MRILNVHNAYQIRGGEDECYLAEINLLREQGHCVKTYQENNDRISQLGGLKTAVKTVWSTKTYQAVKRQLSEQTYDIVHVHNFFPLISPSVYYAAKACKVPVVQTLHNYRLLCPNAQFFRGGRICESCMSKSLPWSSIVHSCYRGNRAATSVVTAMLVTHRLLRTWTAMVDVYVALTEFSRQKFIEGGIPSEKIVVKPNFVPDPGLGGGRGEYALYAGRLSPEKGIDLLLAAWEQMGKKIPLKIVGDGPLADKVAAAAESIAGVEWLGHQPLEQVYTLLREAAFLVFPSEWYEGLPRILVEAFAVGTPAIVADLGSMKSLVSPYHTGLQFQAGDATDLAAKVEWLLEHPAAMARMRLEARSEFEAKYTAIKNYQKLLEIYSLASA